MTSVSAVTHTFGHPDTTSVSGPATVASPGGPVWAHDNLKFTLTAVPAGTHKWSVTITGTGTYQANANPINGAAFKGHGSINGWLKFVVSSPTAPNAEYVPYLEPSSFTQTAIVNQLFGGTATSVQGHYNYAYTGIPGAPNGVYTQVG
jgi:hypothetical protein